MKKILNSALILFIFCLTFTFSGVFFDVKTTNAASSQEKSIGTAEELKEFVEGYSNSFSDYTIYLTNDIDFNDIESEPDRILTKTIGDATNPFTGVFDGRGYKISNLNVSIESAAETNVNSLYAGLFGVVDGATIKNVAFLGNTTLSAKNCDNAYFGTLAGKVENATVENVQNTSSITLKAGDGVLFDNNVNFGSLIGLASFSNIKNVICRSSSLRSWTLANNYGKLHNIGGIVGKMSSSSLTFGVVCTGFDVDVESTFEGTINLGGIVGNVNAGKIINIACENAFNVQNDALENTSLNVGEVAGTVTVPAPNSGNISYIHFKANTGINRFGNQGDYVYLNKTSYDYITVALYDLNKLENGENGSAPKYFDLNYQLWDDNLGSSWDFKSVWYVGSQLINLQCFYGDYDVQIATSLNSEVLKCKTTLEQDGYRYGDSVTMEFEFVVDTKGGNSANMFNYYDVDCIELNGVNVCNINTITSGNSVNYSISGSDFYEIAAKGNGFVITILSVNQSTFGDYSITVSDKENYTAEIISKLFEGENVDQEVVDYSPGYIYRENGEQTRESVTLKNMVYGRTYRIETKVKPSTANSFVGWYVVKDGADAQLIYEKNTILEFTFGQKIANSTVIIDSSCLIYAKYQDDACIVTFDIDEGIMKIDLYDGDLSVDESSEEVPVSKKETGLKLEIYILPNHSFDVDEFITYLDTYKTGDSSITFCRLSDDYETLEYHKYIFILDLTVLTGDSANTFNIKVQTTAQENNDNTWIWIVVGCVGGLIVVGLIIFLIVFLSRRRKYGGGGSSGGSYQKKNYKNMYY